MKAFIFCLLAATGMAQPYDVILKHGQVYDGLGNKPFFADVGIKGDTIAFIGDLSAAKGKVEFDVTGMAVSPGFINMLSWADGTLIQDGLGVSDIMQGVTLEVFGEGVSPAPRKRKPGDKLWGTMGEYFRYLETRRVSPNFASFVGATTIRTYVMGKVNRAPSDEEMVRMKKLVTQAMEEGAMGVGSSLIYAPAAFATTDELIELCKPAAEKGGMYISHIRSEGENILPALNEVFRISKEAGLPAEIYHLKVLQSRNWPKIDTVLFKIDSARKAGLSITANMYPYIASATGLKERIPNWAQEGTNAQIRARILNPETRAKILYDMANGIPTRNSNPGDVMLMGFRTDSLNKLYKGKRLDEVAKLHGKNADETVLDLLIKDRLSIGAIYFTISEVNMKRIMAEPYVSVGSDAGTFTITADIANQISHPRAYGTFARILGKYTRDEKILTLEEAIRRMTSLPASHLKIAGRGSLMPGNYADIVVFDPEKIQDMATFEQPHQYAAGVTHVFVNGVQVLKFGAHTGAKPGRCVRGPGWVKKK